MSSTFALPPVLQDYAAVGRVVDAQQRPPSADFRSLLEGAVAKPEAGTPAKRPITVVAPRTTRLSGSEAKSALAQGWRNVFGEEPSDKTSQLLLAQWSLETGRGKAMMNNNFGGIKGAGPTGLTARYGTHEVENGKTVAITDGFRAYEAPEQGATDYVKLLSKRYGSALDSARAGDAQGFVHGLKKGGYFTAPEAQYSSAISSLASRAASLGADAIGEAGEGAAGPASSGSASVNGAPNHGVHSASYRARALNGAFPPSAFGFSPNRLSGEQLMESIADAALNIARGPRNQEDTGRRSFDDAFERRF